VLDQEVQLQQRGAADGAALPPAEAAERLLRVVQELALELHPQRRRSLHAELDSSLERDLALDSLARVELWGRVERDFGVRLPESLLGEVETPRDLLEAILRGGSRAAAPELARVRLPATDLEPEALPDRATTLLEVLDWHVQRHPDRPHLILGTAEGEETLSYRQLWQGATRVAAGLQLRGHGPGESIAIMLPTARSFFESFLGVLLAGGIPVPIYPPLRPAQLEDHLRRQAGILSNAGASALITLPEGRRAGGLLRSLTPGLHTIETADALGTAHVAPAARLTVGGEDIALLQYTSGSTGQPKGVVLTHANLLANIRAMGRAVEVTPADVFVSWLPLYHDMGLIGAWLGTLYHAVPAVILSPLQFLARPLSWLAAIHRHRGTLSAAPNFGYELCVRRISDAELEGLDLSSWRYAANGAEPVSPATLRRFSERFARCGFRPEAMAPVYGLAECAVGLTFPPPGRGPRIDRIEREALTRRGSAVPAKAGDAHALEMVGCGRPLPGHEVRIVDAMGRELGERRQGRLQFRGPSATQGYFRNPDKTRELLRGDWLESGDLAYIAGGDVYLTGRTKDLIIRAGRNVYAHEIEEAIGDVAGVRKGCVAVFGAADPSSQTERIVVLAETRETAAEPREALRHRVEEVAAELLDGPPDEVVLAPPHTVLKTSSGKIRRAACRELYESGRIGQRPRAVWWQVIRLGWAGLRPRLTEGLSTAGALLYGAWWWTVVVALGLVTWPLVLVLPGERARWALARAVARALLALWGSRVRLDGVERVPDGPAVLVVNHSSYVDGVVLVAALPRPCSFVAKRQLEGQRVAGPFLRRLGALFVERVDPRGGVEDTRRVADALRKGRLAAFFPEGTFLRMPGLLPFRMGAFVTAADAAVPVVPAALRGTRSMLRGDQWLPRRGDVDLWIGEPIPPQGSDWAAALRLRDAARAQILAACGEPDLGERRVEL
jgi:1-acyl-sn-glycerol-3-phosphate acyltransferase